ncbi:MAG TPA: hypothetical protein VMS54_12300 [Vicinamibacterales bacterium]|nr:hypothetical protein [Vicinamibacterales bacterium]
MDQYLVIGPDGKEFGPIDLNGLQQWIREGRVLKQTRIRKNGGAAIAAESLPEVAETFAPPPAAAATPPIATTVPILPEFKSWEFIGQAWELVKPHWIPLSVMFLILGVIGAVPYVGPCLSFIVGTTLLVGINRAVLGLLAGRAPTIEMMFSGFDRFGQAFVAGLVIAILVSVGLVFLIIPGIFLAIIWSFTNLVIAETNQDFWTAMQTSADLTKGYRWEVFCLCLALIVVAILGLLACCIGIVVAQAVGAVAFALAYRFLQSRQATPVAVA